jgi:hypothetical protein
VKSRAGASGSVGMTASGSGVGCVRRSSLCSRQYAC